jgi:signal transduction histidine kinase
MFITHHDLATLAVILAAATTVGILIVLALGWQADAATRSLRDAARRIGEGDMRTPVARPPTAEFAQIAEELSTMTARLDEVMTRERIADRSRRELIAWVSHDLRTPLAAIRAVAEALEDDLIDDPAVVARYHRTLRSEADRLAGLVDDLFELSRINSGSLQLDLQPVSLKDLVSDSLAAASVVASAKQVRLDGTMCGETADLMASMPEVARALSNVLDNAIQHTPTGGTVSVEAGVDGGNAYVAVEDGCGGIPPGDLDRVFEPAFRGEPARTPRPDGAGGAGLGLAIARGLIRAHRGDISVSNVRLGCRFVLRLPSRSAAEV